MGFTINWKSNGGYWQTLFPRPTHLADYPNERAEPGSGSTSEMALWAPFNTDLGGGTVNIPAFTSMEGIRFTTADMFSYLTSEKILCEFEISDSSMAPTGGRVCLALKGEIRNQDNLYIRPSRRIYDEQDQLVTETSMGADSIIGLNTDTMYKVLAGTFIRGNVSYLGIGMIQCTANGMYTEGAIYYNTPDNFAVVFGGTPSGEESSPEFGPASKPGGGYNQDVPPSGKGTFDNSSDIITPSSKPTLTPLSSNLVHAYKVDVQTLNNIANAIYVDLANDWSSVETALEAIYNAIFAAKYVDFLLDLLILPINVPAPNLVDVKVGGKYLTLSSGRVQSYLVTDPYVDFNCGSITIPEYWANFLDYTGTKVKLFLPYIGYVDIQPEYVISGELNVKYRFNVLDGSFIVHVLSTSGKSELDESMIGQYAGVAAVHVPLQASDYATKVSGLISAIGTVAAGMAAGGVGTMAGAANLGNTLMQKPGSTHANGYNASSSYLSHRCPYLIIERQVSQFSEKYMEEVGLPLNVTRRLGSMSGLTKCEAAHLDTIPCSVEGKERISQLLAEGVIL